MIEVTLSESELQLAAHAGVRRQIEALVQNRPDRHGFEGLGWDVHCEGALGEQAVAKALDRFWSGAVNTFRSEADVSGYEVKTRSKHHYDLLVRSDDSDDAYFILVTGRAPHYRVHGYMRGADAKQAEFLQTYGDRPAAWFVPQSRLTPLVART